MKIVELTPEEITKVEQERLLTVKSDDRVEVKEPLPFGEEYFKWRRWKEKANSDDPRNFKIAYYSDMGSLSGSAGYALVMTYKSESHIVDRIQIARS